MKQSVGDVVSDVWREVVRQEELWGIRDEEPLRYLAILNEEVLEAGREAQDATWGPISASNDAIMRLRVELIQVAAVAISFVACLNRDKWRKANGGFDQHVSEHRILMRALHTVNKVFQPGCKEPAILPEFCLPGDDKFEAVVRLAQEYKELLAQKAESDGK